ncbi:MAG TPA: hypothetical protein VK117_02640, partial [Pyrinomonadaceae bacterium]|nr:hypothetical protein [Pyrinomonadaceae bacterium]
MLQQFLRGPGLIGLFLFFGSQPICAQSKTPKFEVGAQFSLICFSDLDITEPGFGGRFTYNINDHLAVGVKAGGRTRRIGVFGKVRPGFVHFGNFEKPEAFGVVCTGFCALPTPPFNFSETDIAVDLGGVIELYPSRRTIVRFDVGDTIVHSGSGKTVVLPGITQFPGGFT